MGAASDAVPLFSAEGFEVGHSGGIRRAAFLPRGRMNFILGFATIEYRIQAILRVSGVGESDGEGAAYAKRLGNDIVGAIHLLQRA